jgi:hypothetical protein
MSLPKISKNIIFLWEGRISPYIERVPEPHVSYIKKDISVFSIFLEEDSNYVT